MVAVVGGAIAAAGAIGGAVISSNASSSAAKAQANAAAQGQAFQEKVYGQTVQNLAPYVGVGQNALYSLASLYGLPAPAGAPAGAGSGALDAFKQFTQTPAYQFPYQQGMQALNQSAAARGLTLSGGQMNALQAYGQGYAGQQFGNYVNQLSQLANLGQNSAALTGSQGNSASGNVLQALLNGGQATSAGIIGSANAQNSGIQNAIGSLGNQNVLNALLGANGSSFAGVSSSNPLLSWNPNNPVGTETLGGATANSGSGLTNWFNAHF